MSQIGKCIIVIHLCLVPQEVKALRNLKRKLYPEHLRATTSEIIDKFITVAIEIKTLKIFCEGIPQVMISK